MPRGEYSDIKGQQKTTNEINKAWKPTWPRLLQGREKTKQNAKEDESKTERENIPTSPSIYVLPQNNKAKKETKSQKKNF